MSDEIKPKEKKLTEADILRIMQLVAEVYEKSGKKVETAALLTGDGEEKMLMDNRKPEDIN